MFEPIQAVAGDGATSMIANEGFHAIFAPGLIETIRLGTTRGRQ